MLSTAPGSGISAVVRARSIDLARPTLSGNELRYLTAALEIPQLGGGHFTRRTESMLATALGHPTLLTTSCTHALEMCALLLHIGPGDEVIVPSFTFASTAGAFALFGARPRFADSVPDTLNIDPDSVERLITPRTRAIVCMHYAGVSCDMTALCGIAAAHGIPLVEDFAHGPFGSYRDQPLGSFGSLATLSFHATKTFACGEGGALVVNDPALLERAHVVRDKGTDRRRYLQGSVDRYTWRDAGSSYSMADILAALLMAQLEQREHTLSRRERIHRTLDTELGSWASRHGVQLPTIPAHCVPAWHLYHMVLPAAQDQQDFISHMNDAGVSCAFHYVPLNTTPYGIKLGGAVGDCPVAESAADRLVRLPLHADLSDDEVEYIVNAALQWRPS